MASLASRLAFLRWGVRGFDILVLLAYPTLGAAFAWPGWGTEAAVRFVIFSVLNICLLTFIYLLNDWSDARLNPEEPRQRKVQALKHPEVMSERQVLGLAFALLGIALLGFFFLSRPVFIIGVAITFITLIYSHPRIYCKGVPVLSTLTHHLAFASLYFLAGWALFQPLSPPAVEISLYWGLVLSAGHFSNEIEDFQNDAQARIRTNAIAFGQRLVFRLGLALFLLASLYFLGLAWAGILPRSFAWIGAGLAGAWAIQTFRYRHWQAGDPIRPFRSFYRAVYALTSFLILFLLLWQKK
jgi:4-hydroxybenzoate polyprenyltransferase